MNLFWAIYNYFFVEDLYTLNSAIIYFVAFVICFTLFKRYFKRGLRFLPPLIFMVLAIYFVAAAYSNNGKLKKGLTEEMGIMNLYVAFLLLGVIFCQSDFKVFMFGILPVYIIADVMINKLRVKNYEILLSELPKEHHHLIFPFKLET